jgi:hypothetical protein
VLDVATGAGPSAVEVARLVGSSGLVIATDISLPMLRRAARNVHSLPGTRRTVGDRIRPTLLPPGTDGPFEVEMDVLVGSGRR